MKEGIHPEYKETTITCVCGNVIKTRSTKQDIKIGNLFPVPSLHDGEAEDHGYRRPCGAVQEKVRRQGETGGEIRVTPIHVFHNGVPAAAAPGAGSPASEVSGTAPGACGRRSSFRKVTSVTHTGIRTGHAIPAVSALAGWFASGVGRSRLDEGTAYHVCTDSKM